MAFKRLIDAVTLGSPHPMRRLLAYYLLLAGVIGSLLYFFPAVGRMVAGEPLPEVTAGPTLLRDALSGSGQDQSASRPDGDQGSLRADLELALSTTLTLMGILLLMLPVTWVYMSIRGTKGHDQGVVQTLFILPIVVAGIVMVVRNSVALAFSLAGVVAAVRFRTSLSDSRDVVFLFLAIAVGFAAGVEVGTLAVVLSVVFNVVLLLTWRYDFGRNVLQPTAASAPWVGSLGELATPNGAGNVPDRDLVLALSQKEIGALSDRFARVRILQGRQGKKPRFNAVLSITSDKTPEAETRIGAVLDEVAGRWRLDEVVLHEDKPSQMFYLVQIRKSTTRDDLITAIHAGAKGSILSVDVELGEMLTVMREKQAKQEKKV